MTCKYKALNSATGVFHDNAVRDDGRTLQQRGGSYRYLPARERQATVRATASLGHTRRSRLHRPGGS